MHFRSIVITTFCLIVLLASEDAFAQRYNRRHKKGKITTSYHRTVSSGGGSFRHYQYLGIGLNAMNYYGDLAPVNRAASTDIAFTRPGLGITYGYRYHPQAALKATFNWGLLKGDDITAERDEENIARYYRNLSFRNNINELIVGFDFFLFPDHNSPSGRLPFNAYIFIGAGIFQHSPKGKVPEFDYQVGDGSKMPDAGKWVGLRDLRTEGQTKSYGAIEFNIPISVGAHMRIPATPMDVHLEFGYRFVFTDYLDDVSTRYANLDQFDSQLARVMSDRSAEAIGVWKGEQREDFTTVQLQFGDEAYYVNGWLRSNVDGEAIRGNPKDNDMYFVTQIRVTYIIPPKTSRSAKYR